MKRMQKSFFAIVALLSAASLMGDNCGTDCCSSGTSRGAAPYFSIRSQGENAVREQVGWEEFINLCDMDKFYGAFAIVGEYTQSFRECEIAEALFGSDVNNTATTEVTTKVDNGCCSSVSCPTSCGECCNNILNISGSAVTDRGANDWLADYFGLPRDFQSQISFRPRIRNFVADVQFYFGMAEWADGLYFRLHLPINWTKWELNYTENVINEGTLGYDAGYFSSDAVPTTDLLANATAFFTGSVPTLPNVASSDFPANVTFDALSCGKWNTCCNTDCNSDCNSCSKTRLADVEMVFGWNFACDEDYYFGLNVRAAGPSGNKPRGEFLFEPISGNGGHWQLGGGVDAHAVLWRGEESDSTFSFYLDANVTHLFSACQTRTFDICGKPNSRYALAEKLTSDVVDALAGDLTETDLTPSDLTLSDAQFANEFAPVANLTCSKVNVSAAVQGDVALKFTYANGNGFSWDLGYNFFGRSCEKICRKSGCAADALSSGLWALKGDAHVYGFTAADVGTVLAGTPVPLGATETGTLANGCGADIHQGTNFSDASLTLDEQTRNFNIDNPEFAVADPNAQGEIELNDTPTAGAQTKTSIQPVVLSDANIDLAGTKIISNKVYTHFSYAWLDHE